MLQAEFWCNYPIEPACNDLVSRIVWVNGQYTVPFDIAQCASAVSGNQFLLSTSKPTGGWNTDAARAIGHFFCDRIERCDAVDCEWAVGKWVVLRTQVNRCVGRRLDVANEALNW